MFNLNSPCVCVCVCVYELLSCVWLFVTPWTAARQAPLSMGILQAKRLEWSAIPCLVFLPLQNEGTSCNFIFSDAWLDSVS